MRERIMKFNSKRKVEKTDFFIVTFVIVLSILSFQVLNGAIVNNKETENNSKTVNNEIKNVIKKNPQSNPTKRLINNANLKIPFTGFIVNVGHNPNICLNYNYSSSKSGIAFSKSKIYFTQEIGTNSNQTYSFYITFPGSNLVQPTGANKLSQSNNYYTNGLSLTDVRSYGEVWYYNLYPHIDLRYYMSEKGLKYDFIVNPGGNPLNIVIQPSNNIKLKLTNDQVKYFTTDNKLFIADSNLFVYKENGEILKTQFVSLDNSINAYKLNFDSNMNFPSGLVDSKIIIDPFWMYFSTYFGGSGDDYGQAIAVDTSGNVYVAGYTLSTDFNTKNAYQSSNNGYSDAFVFKLSNNGSKIYYSTYLGGSSDDHAQGIAVDSSGNAYITGYTLSTDFPKLNAYQSTYGGNEDAFVTKLGPTGSLSYSTYIGGSLLDAGNGIAVDSSGNAYVAGWTASSNFPYNIVVTRIQVLNGSDDAFVLKLSSTGSLIYSTYIGGNGEDSANAIAIDSSGNIYITGWTSSQSSFFPTSSYLNSYQGGNTDAFLVKLHEASSCGTVCFYSLVLDFGTYIGGSGDESGNSIAWSNYNVYVTGDTSSTNFNTAGSFYSNTTSLSYYNVFLLIASSYTGSVTVSSVFGGAGYDYGEGIAVDSNNQIYITGYTSSNNFPIYNNVTQHLWKGSYDVFLMRVSSGGLTCLECYSTYIGGNSIDKGYGVAVDSLGNAYVTGITSSSSFPIIPGFSVQTSNKGGYDVFISKISYQSDDTEPSITINKPNKQYYNTSSVSLDYSYSETNVKQFIIYIDNKANQSNIPTGSMMTSLSDGIHNVTIYIADWANPPVIAHYYFTVDTLFPSISITSPSSYYNNGLVTFDYTVSDANLRTTKIYVDSSTANSSLDPSGFQQNLADGQNYITIVATDAAGYSTTKTLNFIVDTVKPIVTISNLLPVYYSKHDFLFNYSDSDINFQSTVIYLDSSPNSTNWDSGHPFSLPDGVHNITVVAFDKAGNSASQTIIFTIDTVFPSITILSPNTAFTNKSSETLLYQITENNIQSTTIYLDSIANDSLRESVYNYVSLSDGKHNITIVVVDMVGHKTSQSYNFIVDTVKPVISVYNSFPNDNAVLKSNTLLNFSVNDPYLFKVLYKWDSDQSYSHFTNNYTVILEGPDGKKSLTIIAVDKAGNLNNVTYTYIADDTPPDMSVTGIKTNDVISGTVLLSVSASDTNGINRVEISVNNQIISTLTQSPYTYQLDSTSFKNGQYTVHITAYDKAGNKVTDDYSITVNNSSAASQNDIILGGAGIEGTLLVIVGSFTIYRRKRQKQVNDNIDNLLDSYGKSDKTKKG